MLRSAPTTASSCIVGLALALLLLVAPLAGSLPAPRGARADGELELAVLSVDDSDFPVVRVVLSADRLGRPLAAIPAEALRVDEGGRPARVRSIERAVDASADLALVLALDTSGSVAGATLSEAQAAASSLIASLAEGDTVTVLSFASEVSLVQAATTDRAAAAAAIASLAAVGNTALYESVDRAAELAAEAGAVRRAVVLLTDGQDFGDVSSVTREQSLEAAAGAPAVFYAIGVGDSVDRAYLGELADRSGGRAFFADGAADVAAIYSALEERLRSQFVLEIESAAAADPRARALAIEVTLEDASGLATLRYASSRPPVAVPTTSAPPPPPSTAPPGVAPATPAAAPAAAEDGASSMPASLAAIAALGAALVGGALLLTKRLRRTRFGGALPPSARGEADRRESSGGALVVELPDGLTVADLGAEPVTIGSGDRCHVRLPAAADIAAEHARIWIRDGRPLLHHIALGHHTWVGDRAVDWASLRDGDEVRIGPVSLRYQDRRAGVAPGEGE